MPRDWKASEGPDRYRRGMYTFLWRSAPHPALTVFDAVKNKPTATIKVEAVAKTPLGPRPMGAALSPDGKQLYVSNGRGESIAVIDVADRKVARLIDGVGARPWGEVADIVTGERPGTDRNVAAVPRPAADPVHGKTGSLLKLW